MHDDNGVGLNKVLYCNLSWAVDEGDTIQGQMFDWPIIPFAGVLRWNQIIIIKKIYFRTPKLDKTTKYTCKQKLWIKS
jgi:hypothetical protein